MLSRPGAIFVKWRTRWAPFWARTRLCGPRRLWNGHKGWRKPCTSCTITRDVTDRVGQWAVDCSEQRDGTEGGGDETSMTLWCRGTSLSVSGSLRPRDAGGKALPLVVRTGRGKLRDQDLRGREELTLTLPAALMNGWILGLWPERERLGTEPNHAARCPSPSPRPSPVRNRRSGTHRHAQRKHVPVSGIRRRHSRWRRLLIPGFWC